jgi:quercetin dioxygenase-like cupin family protein
MKRMPSLKKLTLIAPLMLGISSQALADEAVTPLPMSRQLLMKRELPPMQGTPEVRVIRVIFPSGFKTPEHTHDAAGPRYILKGKLKVVDATRSEVFGPGDVFWETGESMTIESVGGSDAEMVIFEVGAKHP